MDLLACAKPPMKKVLRPHYFLLYSLLFLVVACDDQKPEQVTDETTVSVYDPDLEPEIQVDIQGHRGARGVLPENSLEAFVYALEQGVTTLELDVVVSKDGQLVVSHEPWMSATICQNVEEGNEPNIYKMTYAEVRSFDCGSRGNPRFPDQKKLTTYKPKLSEVFQIVESKRMDDGLPEVWYNIETKSTPEGDGVYHPVPQEFAQLLYNVVAANGMKDRVTIQSFDVRTLQAMKNIDANIPLVLLVSESEDTGLDAKLEELGFVPQAYSPEYTLVDEALVAAVHDKNMKLIPWTVNDSTEMLKLLTLGVDGIITDYPAMGIAVAKKHVKKQL